MKQIYYSHISSKKQQKPRIPCKIFSRIDEFSTACMLFTQQPMDCVPQPMLDFTVHSHMAHWAKVPKGIIFQRRGKLKVWAVLAGSPQRNLFISSTFQLALRAPSKKNVRTGSVQDHPGNYLAAFGSWNFEKLTGHEDRSFLNMISTLITKILVSSHSLFTL